MKISKIKFDNYTNLSGVQLNFNSSCNFFVGENSIGKTNTLRAIHNIYNFINFSEQDFFDKTKPIQIEVEFLFRQKYTNLKDKKIKVTIRQVCGQNIEYFSNDIFIQELKEQLKLISLNNLELATKSIDLKNNLSQKALNLFNELSVVKRAKKYSGLTEISGDNLPSEGLLYSKFFIVNVLNKMLDTLSDFNGENFQGIIIYSIPEHSLHPFAEKTLIKDLLYIASGQDNGFNRFIDRHYGIKKVDIQLFFKSHSDRVLSNDYSNIVRFYRQNGQVKVVCGEDVKRGLSGDFHIKKQLDMQLPYFSLAIFSRCVILIEGASEYGALEEFAKTLEIDLDYLAITIISANGEGNVPILAKLLRAFKIKVFTIRDRDSSFKQSVGDDFYTNKVDFEDEIVSVISPKDIVKVFTLAGIGYLDLEFNSASISRKNARYNITNKKITKGVSFLGFNKSETDRKLFCLTLLGANKSILTGRAIGKVLKEEQIPSVYKQVLILAKEYASK